MAAPRAVVDTNVVVGALISPGGRNRAVLRACLTQTLRPVVGEALFHEYEDVMSRDSLFRTSPLSRAEREQFLDALLSVSEWVQVYYRWRPNLRDEGDNHLMELAVAAGANLIITNNTGDFRGAELRFPEISVVTPAQVLKELI